MRRGNELVFFTFLVILSLAIVFTFLTTVLVNSLGSGSLLLDYVLCILIVAFFIMLVVFVLTLAFLTLLDYRHRYIVLSKMREFELEIRKRQMYPQQHIRAGRMYRYKLKPRQVPIRRRPPDHLNNGQ